jgi:hypothetical protein
VQYSDIDQTEVDLGQLGIDLHAAQIFADKAYVHLTKLKSEVLDVMGTAKWGYYVDENNNQRKVASRQMRAGNPSLIVNKKG